MNTSRGHTTLYFLSIRRYIIIDWYCRSVETHVVFGEHVSHVVDTNPRTEMRGGDNGIETCRLVASLKNKSSCHSLSRRLLFFFALAFSSSQVFKVVAYVLYSIYMPVLSIYLSFMHTLTVLYSYIFSVRPFLYARLIYPSLPSFDLFISILYSRYLPSHLCCLSLSNFADYISSDLINDLRGRRFVSC